MLKTKGRINKEVELVYPELSYQIVGILFEVYNELGHGHPEKTYQKAVAVALARAKLRFEEQLYIPIEFKNEKVGKTFLDFLIEDKIVLEIKKGNYFVRSHIDQVYKYLVAKNLKLGILAYFTPRTVHFKRIINIKS